MKKLMLVLAVLALGSLASAQSVTLGFFDYTYDILYCNYVQLSPAPQFGKSAWQGTDNLSACELSGNATMVGASGKATLKDVSVGIGAIVKTHGVLMADNLFDAFSSYFYGRPVFSGRQWFIAMNLVPDTTPNKFGWLGLVSAGGMVYADNFGHLTATLPKGNLASHGTTAGRFARDKAKQR